MSSLCDGKVILVTGGASSGKSSLAERICCANGGRLLYLATMLPYGTEAAERIARHRAARDGKGFETAERGFDLHTFAPDSRYDAVLLEDLDNLAANQMFEAATPPEKLADVVMDGINRIAANAGLVVAVANDMFSGVEAYIGDMDAYLCAVGDLRSRLAHRAAVVVESVCGLPHVWKGELSL